MDPRVAYYVQGSDTNLYFTSRGMTLAQMDPEKRDGLSASSASPSASTTQRWVVQQRFLGADPTVWPVGEDRTPTMVSYFAGPQKRWKTRLPTYSKVVYPDLWPGIDLIYSGTASRLEYTFRIRPGADPSQIQMGYRGASGVTLTTSGQLRVSTPLGGFVDEAPISYQSQNGQRLPVRSAFLLGHGSSGNPTYTFDLGPYDETKPLVIDPVVTVYSGFIGGSGFDATRRLAIDNQGNAYVIGDTDSTEATFPLKVGPDLTFNSGARDAFVAKVNPLGTGLVYAGYIGGAGEELGTGIAVDDQGNAFVSGSTESSEATFPEKVGPDLSYNGNGDVFVAKVNPAGTDLVYAGYIGGAQSEVDFFNGGIGVDVDDQGNAYVTGPTYSTQATLPVKVGPDVTYNGGADAFVAKVNPSGTGLIYAGYIGGASTDAPGSIAVDGSGRAHVSGVTSSTQATFPVKVGPDITHNGDQDAFVASVDPSGASLMYAGYIGGNARDGAHAIASDDAGNVYVVGETQSSQTTFPEKVGPDLTYAGGQDHFLAKVGAGGALLYAGYIGGTGYEVVFFAGGLGVAVDQAGSAYAVGTTYSSQSEGFPVKVGPDLTQNGDADGYVVKVNPAGTGFEFAGYLGGSTFDDLYGVAPDSAGGVYLAGSSDSSNFPTRVGPDLTPNGVQDAWVAKLSEAPPTLAVGIDIKPGSETNPIKLKGNGAIPVAIISAAGFNATTVDPSSVCFGDDDNPSQRDCTEAHGKGHIADVDADGRLDLLLHYETQETGIDPGDTKACLTGKTFGDQAIQGCDSITTR
jgi:hypothetical protein